MRGNARSRALLAVVALAGLWGCASTKENANRRDPNLITRAEIEAAQVSNLFELVSRLRPQWLRVSTTRSFNLETELVVFHNDVLLGGPDALRELGPEIAWDIRWMDGQRASAMLPGITSGRHILGAIIVNSRPPEGS